MRIPSSDLILMGASVGLAVLLWLWVGAEERSEIIVNVPLEYRNLPKGFEIFSDSQLLTSVNVWVSGTTATLKNLRPQEVSAWIDLSDIRPGLKHFELSPDQVKAPYGFTVLRITPSRVDLKIEQAVTRLVSVVPRVEGRLPEGYAMTKTVVVPPQVEIMGPQSAVASISSVTTDPIDLALLKGDHTERVNITVENSAVRLARVKEANVSFSISEITDLITLRQIPVTVTGTERIVKLIPKVVRVDLLAPKSLMPKLSEEQVKAVIQLDGLKPGIYELTPQIILGPEDKNVTVKAVIPQRIHVRIQ
jgi:YbbR domain-containing protein